MQYDSKVEEMRGVWDSNHNTFFYTLEQNRFAYKSLPIRALKNFQYRSSGSFMRVVYDMELDYDTLFIKWLNRVHPETRPMWEED